MLACPAHHHYIEPFAGSLAVLLCKQPRRMETVNDLDGESVVSITDRRLGAAFTRPRLPGPSTSHETDVPIGAQSEGEPQ